MSGKDWVFSHDQRYGHPAGCVYTAQIKCSNGCNNRRSRRTNMHPTENHIFFRTYIRCQTYTLDNPDLLPFFLQTSSTFYLGPTPARTCGSPVIPLIHLYRIAHLSLSVWLHCIYDRDRCPPVSDNLLLSDNPDIGFGGSDLCNRGAEESGKLRYGNSKPFKGIVR